MESILSIYWTNTRGGAKLSLTDARKRPDRPPPLAGGRPMRVPLSFPEPIRNCLQEAGGVPTRFPVNIHSMKSRFAPSRFTSRPVAVAGWLLLLVVLALEWLAGRASAHAAVVVTPRITLV